eukprot:3146027-Amphidinium_carterae.1
MRPAQHVYFSSSSSTSVNDSDEIDLISLSQRKAVRSLMRPALVAAQEISPTLPFAEPDEVCGVDVTLRGGAPKPHRPARLTWEGTASGSMLKVHSNLLDAGGQSLLQIHVSDLCKDACGLSLVNWSNWSQVSSIRSSNTLLVILPGHRQFETDVPEPDLVTRSDLVIEDPCANKRFPRLVTLVRLGEQKPKEAPTKAQEQALPAPAAPIELLLEVDSRASEDLNPRLIVKAMVDDALQKNGAHNKLFGFRDAVEDSFLVLVAKIRLASDDAAKMLAISGKSGVFIRAASHCAALLPKFALVWLEPHQMESKPVVFLRNAQRQLGSAGGLCRNHRSFGLRAEARLAGRARALLDVQHAQQFDRNEAVIPTMHYIARGLPAMFSSTETAKVLHDGFSWNCVPIRRVKTSLTGSAMWLVGAEVAPSDLHARLGEHLVTIEPSEARGKTKAKKHLKSREPKTSSKNQWRDTQSGHSSAPSSGWGADWDPWASSAALSSGGQQWTKHEQKEIGKWWANKENRKPEVDPWGQFKPPARAVVADNTKLEALETRVAQIEKVQTANSTQLTSVETRIGSVEQDVHSLAGKMQANFDKLFSHFESRNTEGDPARKAPRTDDFRGGSPPQMAELDISEIESKPGLHIAFVNPCSHKGHLDNMLARSLDVVLIGESNHTAADVCPSRRVATEGEGSLLYHLAWTKPTRTAGDQQVQGRASSGIVIASKQYLALHPHESQAVRDMGDLGRLILRRLEAFPGIWINIWGLYGPVVGWGCSSEGSTKFLAEVVSEILSSPNELSLLIGDFNVEFQHDIVAQAARKMNSLLDIGHLLSDEARQQPTTYRTQNAASRIDRAMCTPSLLRYVSALTVCTGAATGSHLPVVVTLHPCGLKIPPILTEVLAIPEGKGERDPTKVTDWQLANAQRMADFCTALDEYNLDLAYYLWASLWEAFLQDTHPQAEEFNWEKHTGRATCKQQLRTPLKVRQKTQVHTEEEAEGWRLLGILQSFRQGRSSFTNKARAAAERLHRKLQVKRSLPDLDWSSAEVCGKLEEAVKRAIAAERARRIAVLRFSWKSRLNLGKGSTGIARSMVRGPSPRLHMLTSGNQASTCPEIQCQLLVQAWDPIGRGEDDKIIHPDIWSNVCRETCPLPRIVAGDVKTQISRVKKNTSNGPDWWRQGELHALPDASFAMLASLFNTLEAAEDMPSQLMGAWTKPLPKSGTSAEALGVRPITILPLIHRVWSGLRYRQLQGWVNSVLHPSQAAFRQGRSCKSEVQALLVDLTRRANAGQASYLGQLDLSKAFPRLNKEKSRDIAVASGLSPSFGRLIHRVCLGKASSWKIAGVLSAPMSPRRGTPQGCALSIMMFQLTLAPVARAVANFLRMRCSSSRLLLYADDLIIVASSSSLLAAAMGYATLLLESLDFQVNVAKSSVSLVGMEQIPRVLISNIEVPFVPHPDLFGCTLTTTPQSLPAPNSLPDISSSRTMARWIKAHQRLIRLSKLPVVLESKLDLWRALILPVITYDCWMIMPSNSTIDSWTSLIVRSIFTAVQGKRDRHLACSSNPQHIDLGCILLQQLAREAVPMLISDPLQDFLVRDIRRRQFHSPITAFAHLALQLGFSVEPEGMLHSATGSLIMWPPESIPLFLHDVREAMRKEMIRRTSAPLERCQGSIIQRAALVPRKLLSRTQANFLVAMQLDALRSKQEVQCPFCLSPGGVEHAIWHCPSRPWRLVGEQPARADSWPYNFRRFALLLDGDTLAEEELRIGQDFMTRVLIERRGRQRELDQAAKRERAAKRRRVTTVYVEDDDDGDSLEQEEHPELTSAFPDSPQGVDQDDEGSRSTNEGMSIEHQSAAPQHRAFAQLESAEVFIPGRASSSTAVAGPTVAIAEVPLLDLVSDEEESEQRAPPGRAKRFKWDLDQLPQHIVLECDQFKQRYVCKQCACYSARSSRSGFFRKHFACDGTNVHASKVRHFERKALLASNRGIRPDANQVLSPEWYQYHGVLPRSISQPVPNGLLTCVACGSTSHPCNRRRFITAHIKCLSHLIVWGPGEEFTYDDVKLDRARLEGARSTFELHGGIFSRRGSKPRFG